VLAEFHFSHALHGQLHAAFLERGAATAVACTPQQHLLQAVVGVFAQMRHQQNGPISAAPVEEALCQLHPQIFKVCGKYHQQQDAAEAWTLLTNNLQKAFLQSNNPEVHTFSII